mmetsp:Transcript_171193/g.548792  ORF Transcript_171193/g.548792 Transcript_171193/m.548792 type:complete len:318 (-) Transcript_171193:305-1258(-)
MAPCEPSPPACRRRYVYPTGELVPVKASVAAAAVLGAPDLLRPAFLPFCDATTALRLLAASRSLSGEVQHLPQLEVVLRRRGCLDEDALRGLAALLRRAVGLRSLRLGLGYQELGPEGAEKIAKVVATIRGLVALTVDLRRTQLGELGVAAWAEAASGLPALTSLDLRCSLNALSSKVIIALAESLRRFRSLSVLCIQVDINPVGDEAATALLVGAARVPGLATLSLDLAQCGLGERGARSLADALSREVQAPASVDLDLRGNCLRHASREALAKAAASLEARGHRQDMFSVLDSSFDGWNGAVQVRRAKTIAIRCC